MPAIQCNQGDLYQEYMGEASAPTNIAPDFASLKPVLSFILTSSRVAEGLVVPSSMKWYFNDVEIKWFVGLEVREQNHRAPSIPGSI